MTVAVFEETPESAWTLNERDLEIFVTKDTGPGGQHRNKTESCIIIRHIPTGIEAKAADRCQHQNRRTARAVLEARVKARYDEARAQAHNASRKEMVGSGMRADKMRTYCAQHGTVTDHRSDKKCRLKDVLSGKLELLA